MSPLKAADWPSISARTRTPIPASWSSGVMPSGEVSLRGAMSCSCRPATRTWKKSSRLSLKIARKRILSASGRALSSAIVSTRLSKSRRESSRLKNLSWGRARVCDEERSADLTAMGLLLPRQGGIGEQAHRQRERRPAQPECQAADDVARPVLAKIDAPDANGQEHERGQDPGGGHDRLWQPANREAHD